MSDRATVLGNVFTLGTRDLPTLRAFYVNLGWRPVVDQDDYVAFQLRGAVIALFPVETLAADGRCLPGKHGEGIRFSLGIIADAPEDVDQLMSRVRQAGGEITKEAEDAEFFTGRSAYFKDPEGNLWEVAWAPRDNPVVTAARKAARDEAE